MTVIVLPHTTRDPKLMMAHTVADALRGIGVTPVFGTERDALEKAAFAIAMGGDGSVLRAAHICAPYALPILSINLGNTGFLTELEPDELPLLEKAVRGDYQTDDRMMLDILLENGHVETALNDVVFRGGAGAQTIHLDFWAEDKPLTRFSGDGAMVATPTGSTAYSLSAGGPLVEPGHACLLLTPICPHTLYLRSIVLSAEHCLRMRADTKKTVYAAFDGERTAELKPGQIVEIRKSKLTAKLIRLKESSFFSRVSTRLGKAVYGGETI